MNPTATATAPAANFGMHVKHAQTPAPAPIDPATQIAAGIAAANGRPVIILAGQASDSSDGFLPDFINGETIAAAAIGAGVVFGAMWLLNR